MRFSEFAVIGVALYGERWRSDVARDLGVTYRSVARWATVGSVPDRVVDALRAVVRERLSRLEAARKLLWSERRE